MDDVVIASLCAICFLTLLCLSPIAAIIIPQFIADMRKATAKQSCPNCGHNLENEE